MQGRLGTRGETTEPHACTLVTLLIDSVPLGQAMWKTPAVPWLQIWKRFGCRGLLCPAPA